MNNEQTISVLDIDPVILDTLNHFSGAYASLFWHTFYNTTDSIAELENLESAICLLYSGNRFEDAFTLIRTYHEIFDMTWFNDFFLIDNIPELKPPFLYEFLHDTREIIFDLKIENLSGSKNIH